MHTVSRKEMFVSFLVQMLNLTSGVPRIFYACPYLLDYKCPLPLFYHLIFDSIYGIFLLYTKI